MKFALYFGNRGFFPESLIALARKELTTALSAIGIDSISLPVEATRYGAVETSAEGWVYAKFLKEHEGEYDGVILCLPNFGDENGASEALRDCGVPIYIMALPDEMDKMDFEHRRDSFCGKLSIMDVFQHYGIPFTAWPPHTISATDPRFPEEMRQFSAVCRIVKRLKRCRIGAIGARPTAFKTIRFDEVTLQRHQITTESFDNSDLLLRFEKVKDDSKDVQDKIAHFINYCDFSGVPADAMRRLARVSVAIDNLVKEQALDAVAIRCWNDMQGTLKIAPCILLSELNDRGIVAACETDVCNAVTMLALQAASDSPACCLDWNNNYPGDENKVILFHCGPIAQSLMAGKGQVIPHKMFAKVLGPECSYGCNVGCIRPMDFTYASTMTADGAIKFYSGEGRFTNDPLGEGFFGCAGVAEIPGLQEKINKIGYSGYRHHVSATEGNWKRALDEAFCHYLKYQQTTI